MTRPKRSGSPLRVLSWALHEVAAGRLETRVQARIGHRDDELADLGEDFDRMAQQLQQLTQSRNELLHDISHELRLPLARLQVAIGLLKQDPAQHDAMLERIERESARLDALIKELLTWHRLEAGVAPPPTSRVDVLELLHAITEDADFEAQSEGKAVRIEAAGQFVAEVHGELMCRAFENVIRNAIKFTAPGSEVWVRATVDETTGVLHCTVDDHGPGVPPQALEAMFEPFTRVDGSQGGKGVGLGLAIARRAMELHGGHIRAQPGAQAGLRVSLVLPPTRV